MEFFLFYLDLELFAKIKKDLVFTHSFFTLLLITQDLNKRKKSLQYNAALAITDAMNCLPKEKFYPRAMF